MAKLNIRDKLILALLARGYSDLVKRPKYWIFNKGPLRSGDKVYLGPLGSLRIGQTHTQSRSFTDGELYDRLLQDAEQILAKQKEKV